MQIAGSMAMIMLSVVLGGPFANDNAELMGTSTQGFSRARQHLQ